ncbi:RdgB/HAM1 family non-canonical purine NTP pyrophosphatase [Tateyamaria sp. ANG-S1]|uniref:RdgB/HAM1 family non-canonical purine NTP pyrophosphatase n=1 Tax=Tateyamaria sp. ANG-S1 TaxID=1577905 RepID=UPI00058082F3|nr:RdgB/HAM1 family non-canonical purine NTP pyrophosphatase [Tateyamaria sp. ANG-S1]KIC49796.1 nucleoside-triphosphate diphosphatase [Tateyamaria sp. ANG-S1]
MTRRFEEDRILVATHNAGKLEEMEQLFHPFRVSVVGAKEMNLGEPEETETTFVGNARIKARAAVEATGLPALADDSGIEVDGLDGAPGVYTADWAETPNGRDFMLAMTRTHSELQDRKAAQPWTARFCSTLVLAWPDGHEEIFAGTVEGTLVWPVRGKLGHGYDPMFQPLGHERTFAEMSADEKNAISHRADSFKKLIAGCFG